ncbi:glycerol-3-phosphate 1-O-acyltransferase PlsY [Novosphingobium sp. Gsoil 351]|uniref:glycerol-3-phosphate 1-O-acyltransferase PlsY n=1 Tax=Novosphingobium sp. Gsoil 351 TaxID=2675225 RepID=UPI0012B4EB86|nr:glycerol-3-phosphate 1-O-acyltransferase PlsY [Novosphingobium sp. Gsoil 351]QGN55978.1 glycerol-3-phosphate 1-O-acyltransferase PlsY [Novosphingobium sp. Gsoil 351]
MDLLAVIAIAYLLGSIPFGLLLTRLGGTQDLRTVGSGNIGATNVLRTGRKGLAVATLVLDLLKGAAAVVIAWRLFPPGAPWAALAAVVGHCFPVWLGFRGGKGVATLAGVCLALAWPIWLAYAVVWFGVFGLSRISSLAGMSAALAAPIAAAVLGHGEFVPALALVAALILWLHRGNIARLRAGTEAKVGEHG